MEIKKHVGRIKNTDGRIVVVYMQIPGDPSNSLVIETDSLPDMMHDALYRVVDSQEAKSTINLGDLLGRRPSPQPGMDLMTYFHRCGRLRAIPVTSVVMYPYPNQPMPLEEIIRVNGGTLGEQKAPAASVNEEKYNPFAEKQKMNSMQANLAIATNKLQEAELLDLEAAKKREEAYVLFPQLRPGYRQPSIEEPTVNPSIVKEAMNPVQEEQIFKQMKAEPVFEEGISYPVEDFNHIDEEGNIISPSTIIESAEVEEVSAPKRGRKKST